MNLLPTGLRDAQLATSSSIATLLPQLSYPDGVGIVDASCRWDRAASSSLA